jgi:hypothetical protein
MRKINATRITAPATEPTTIPAMSPPDNPFFDVEAWAVAVAVADEVDDDVGVAVEKVMKAVIVGNTTPAHL